MNSSNDMPNEEADRGLAELHASTQLATAPPLPHALTEVRLQPEPAITENPARVILVVEDNAADVRLIRDALASCTVPLRVQIARDGTEALSQLHRGRKPNIILLDLNLPGLDGRTLLRRIKSDPELLRIPVIVLTSSDAPLDVGGAYDLHANCYLVKPATFRGFEHALHQMVDFWTGIAQLPGP